MDRNEITQGLRAQLEQAKKDLEEKESGLTDLRTTVQRLENAVASMDGAISVLDSRGYMAKKRSVEGVEGHTRRQLSPESRERIRQAQQKRWAKVRENESKAREVESGVRQTPLARPGKAATPPPPTAKPQPTQQARPQ